MAVLGYNRILDIRMNKDGGHIKNIRYPDWISVNLGTKMAAKMRGCAIIFPILTRYPNSKVSGYQDFPNIGRPVIGL
jgi:hypothetical protein